MFTPEELQFLLPPGSIPLDFNEDDESQPILEVKSNEEVFKLELQNNGLGSALKRLLSLIESGKEMNLREDVSDLLLDILELLCDSEIRLSAVGAELIVRELARNPDNRQEKSYAKGNVEFLRLTSAIMESSSLGVSLSFQDYNKLLNGRIFHKTQSSPLDLIY